ncbi:CARD- and ANK-domain containing inflammasome adapter protein [Hemitrygon akajei]|uniref:CARD- and ANK-domain containing inflammasome adapter protein n=1 Tax=Hemitrygon akajei TaxID=2704970 RepID=UPI003BF9CFDA
MPLHGTGIFTNPYAIEVLQSKKKELVAGITHTDDLLDWLIENRVISPEKRIAVLNYRTREEMNARVLDMLVSCGERACRLFFYPCLKHVEPALYNYIRSYVSNVSSSFGDAKRQLVGYLLERDKDEIPKDTSKNVGKPVQNVASKKEPHQKLQTAVQTRPVHNELAHLFQIVASGDLSSLDKAIGHSDINDINAFNETLLHIAATHGHVKIIEYLLNKGAKLEVKDNKGQSPLHRAAEKGHTAAAKVLLQAGAHSYALDTESKTPLHLASQNNFFSVVKLMLKEEARNYKRKKSFLHMAALRDESKIAEILLKCGAAADIKDEKNRTPLIHAVSLGHLSTVKVLITKGAHLNERTPNMNSALHLAAETGSLSVAKLLIDEGMDVNIIGCSDQTPLHFASFHNQPPMIEALIRAGSKVNAIAKEAITPLHIASQRGNRETVECLLQNKADVNAKDRLMRTPLHMAAIVGDASIAELLLSSHADPNAVNKEKKTPLHLAANEGHLDFVSMMLSRRARFAAKDMDGNTPMHYAASKSHSVVVKALLLAGKNKNIDDKNIWRKTPLHLAAEHSHEGLVELLLVTGASINALDNAKDTPLHCACKSGNIGTAQKLINWSDGEIPKFHSTNSLKKTPLQVAESRDTDNHQQIAILLRKKMMLTR